MGQQTAPLDIPVGGRTTFSSSMVLETFILSRSSQLAIISVLIILGIAWVMFFRPMGDHMASSPHMSGSQMPESSPAQSTPIATGLTIPDLSVVEKLGERAFNENCAVCHGKNGAGNEGAGPPLVHIIYEPNHHGDMSFQLAVKNGVRAHHWPFGNMPPIPDVLEGEVANIIAYIRALQRANGIN